MAIFNSHVKLSAGTSHIISSEALMRPEEENPNSFGADIFGDGSRLMSIKQCHKPPMGMVYTAYKNGDLGDGKHCFTHVITMFGGNKHIH